MESGYVYPESSSVNSFLWEKPYKLYRKSFYCSLTGVYIIGSLLFLYKYYTTIYIYIYIYTYKHTFVVHRLVIVMLSNIVPSSHCPPLFYRVPAGFIHDSTESSVKSVLPMGVFNFCKFNCLSSWDPPYRYLFYTLKKTFITKNLLDTETIFKYRTKAEHIRYVFIAKPAPQYHFLGVARNLVKTIYWVLRFCWLDKYKYQILYHRTY